MAKVPLPRAANDTLQVGIAWLPAQLCTNPCRGGDQYRWVARPARPDFVGYGVASHVARNRDHLFVTEALPIAQIVGPAALVQRSQRQDVRLRQIDDVDIVAHTGTIRRGIVIAEEREGVALAQR